MNRTGARRIVFYTRYGSQAGSSRTRAFEYVEPLQRLGFTVSIVARVNEAGRVRAAAFEDLLAQAEDALVVVQKPNLTFTQLNTLLRITDGGVVADFDDAIWMGYGPGDPPDGIESIIATLRAAETVTTGSRYLARWARNVGSRRVVVIPPSIDLNRYRVIRMHHDVPRPVVVWIGTSGNFGDLDVARGAMEKLLADRTIRFRVISDRPLDWPDTEFVPWSFADEAAQLGACDIGIMPLVDNERTRGRCGYKAVQYQAAGLPVVASPVGGAQEVVRHQITGIFANSAREWTIALEALARSAKLRADLGRAARKNVEQQHSIAHNAGQVAAICAR
ncbi:MAG: glycosyltransferase family 4 protein [Mycobacterium sp.]|nr:glycosyltransferase family 4 protein [Mycobacterium sp.]